MSIQTLVLVQPLIPIRDAHPGNMLSVLCISVLGRVTCQRVELGIYLKKAAKPYMVINRLILLHQ